MLDRHPIVCNTTPLLAIIAAVGNLDIIRPLYSSVIVPREVADELVMLNLTRFGVREFQAASWIERVEEKTPLDVFLNNALDSGEAAVIQLAITRRVARVAIDELPGRRIARLYGLQVTGSIGMLLKVKQQGHPMSMREMIDRMLRQGIHLAPALIQRALTLAGE